MISQHHANPQMLCRGLIGIFALGAAALLVPMPAPAQDILENVRGEMVLQNTARHVLHIFEYSLPGQTALLEFSQDECQASVTEEYIIPDVPADPSKPALSMFF
jgi:hypothetical protein